MEQASEDPMVFSVKVYCLQEEMADHTEENAELQFKTNMLHGQDLSLCFKSTADHGLLSIEEGNKIPLFQFPISEDLDCCQVGGQSFIVTFEKHSCILQFRTEADMKTFQQHLRRQWDKTLREGDRKGNKDVGPRRHFRPETSPSNCYQFHSCLSQQQSYLQDYNRTATYHRAILLNETDFKDKVVLDVGGSGMLSFFAVQAGAAKVYSVHSGPMVKYTQVGGESLPQAKEFKYLGVLFTSEGRMEREIDRRIGAASAVMRSLHRTVVVKRELSRKAKLSIYRSIYAPTLTYGHELWVMTKRTRNRKNQPQSLFQSNGQSGRILVLNGDLDSVVCPEKVDLLLSEPMGHMLLSDAHIQKVLSVKKWLKPGGVMFPSWADLHLALFSDEQLYFENYAKAAFWQQRNFFGINLSSLHNSAVDEFFRQPIVDTFDVQILMSRSVKHQINFKDATPEDLHRLEIPFRFILLQSGLVHGLAFWFDMAFQGSKATVWMSTAPTEPLTRWYQVRCLFQTPLFAKMGQTLTGTVLMAANERQSYDVHITATVDQSGFTSGNVLDLKNPFFRMPSWFHS